MFDMLLLQDLPWPALLDEARYLEDLGIGTLWVADHYALPPRPTAPIFEAWTTLAALAARTTRLRLGTLVSNVATRHPAMLAKLAATVDAISNGRVDLGVGAGGGDGLYRREYDWLGIPPLTRGERVVRLRESVEVLDGFFRDHRLTYHGTHYGLDDAPLVPAPIQHPRPPLYIAAQGKQALRVAARYADGWISLGDPTTGSPATAQQALRDRNHILDDACAALGRPPTAVERLYFAGWGAGEVPFASADAFQDFVGAYRSAGVQRFIFSFASQHRTPPPANSGRSATRQALEAFAAVTMADFE
jgi:alkanesulfonate monooxygenase SsuD/methylene tetrahydromethanopterin reductase-like flavin-dependent oxidoreductase (luciferase family)